MYHCCVILFLQRQQFCEFYDRIIYRCRSFSITLKNCDWATNVVIHHVEVETKWPPFCRKHLWCLFSRTKLNISQHLFRSTPSLCLKQWWPGFLRRYASFDLNELPRFLSNLKFCALFGWLVSQGLTLRRGHMPGECRYCPRAHKPLWFCVRMGKWFFSLGMHLFSQHFIKAL